MYTLPINNYRVTCKTKIARTNVHIKAKDDSLDKSVAFNWRQIFI
jgi:hypothetical protein